MKRDTYIKHRPCKYFYSRYTELSVDYIKRDENMATDHTACFYSRAYMLIVMYKMYRVLYDIVRKMFPKQKLARCKRTRLC